MAMLRRSGVIFAYGRPKIRLHSLSSSLRFSPLQGQLRYFTQSSNKPLKEDQIQAENKTLDTKIQKADKRVWPIVFSTFLMGTAIGIVVPIMPLFVKDLGLTSTELGLIISTMGLCRVVANIPFAVIADVYGRKPLLTFGPLMISLSNFGTGLATGFLSLFSARSVTGFSSSAQMVGAQLYLADISTPSNRATTQSYVQVASNLGFATGPAVAGYLADASGYRVPFFFVGAIFLSIATLNSRILPESNPLPLSLPPGTTLSQKMRAKMFDAIGQWKQFVRDPAISSGVLLHTTFWIVTSGCQMTLLPLYVSETLGYTSKELGAIYTIFAILTGGGSWLGARFSDKYGRKAALIPGSLFASASVALTPFFQDPQKLGGLLLLWCIGHSLIQSSITAFIIDRTVDSTRSQAIAFLRTGGDLGLFIGALMMGFLAQKFGMEVVYAGNGVLLTSVALLFAFRTRRI